MADTAFRKIDIDAFDEDTVMESELYEPDPRDSGTVLNDARQKQTSVRSSLSR
jgi:actin related protein 2/3 complex, subunit 5